MVVLTSVMCTEMKMGLFHRMMAVHFNNRAEGSLTEVMQLLPLKEGAAVADLGCGGGAFTLEFARRLGPAGEVYAVDVNASHLAYVRDEARKAELNNRIILVLAEEDDSLLPENSIDLVFSRFSYHHIKEQIKYFTHLKRALKPTGSLVIIDHDVSSRHMAKHGHAVSPEQIRGDLRDAGFTCTKQYDHLPGQSFQMFTSN